MRPPRTIAGIYPVVLNMIVMLGTSTLTKGGIATVLSTYARAGLFERWPGYSYWRLTRMYVQRKVEYRYLHDNLVGLLVRRRVALFTYIPHSDASFWRKAGFVF